MNYEHNNNSTVSIKCYDNFYSNTNDILLSEIKDYIEIIQKDKVIYKNLIDKQENLEKEINNYKLNEEQLHLKIINLENKILDLQNKNKNLIDKNQQLETKLNNDYITKYGLLRKKELFSFTPILSKEYYLKIGSL